MELCLKKPNKPQTNQSTKTKPNQQTKKPPKNPNQNKQKMKQTKKTPTTKLKEKQTSTTLQISFLGKYCGQAIATSDTRQEVFRHVTKQLCNLVSQDFTDLPKN